MKTEDIPAGPALDYAVAVADLSVSFYTQWVDAWTDHEVTDWYLERGLLVRKRFDGSRSRAGHWEVIDTFSPSSNWSQGGEIIDRECISLRYEQVNPRTVAVEAEIWPDYSKPCTARGYGTTALAAAMRCFVASKMGATIELPEEVTKSLAPF